MGAKKKKPEQKSSEKSATKKSVTKKSGSKKSAQAVVPAAVDVDLDVRDLQVRVEFLQEQFVGVVAALGESTVRLQAAVALIAELPTRDAATDSGRELRQRLEQMLVAQQRTNELLDLALGVAVASDGPRDPS